MTRLRSRSPGAVLARVDLLVAEELDKVVVARRDTGAHHGTQPVDPVVAGEAPSGHGGTEAACRVEGAAGEEDACGRIVSVHMTADVTTKGSQAKQAYLGSCS